MILSELEMRRLEDKISDLHKKLEENQRISKRNDERERWELDRLSREFAVRKSGYEQKKVSLTKDLEELVRKRDRELYKISIEKEAELAGLADKHGGNFNHRIH
jgi:hypothetical protein